jgi:hypothetical protein
MPEIGASTPPASIFAAIRAPIVSRPSKIRNTPAAVIKRLVSCCAVPASVSDMVDQNCTSSPVRAAATTDFSHSLCIRVSAPATRTVSAAERDSTSTPWRALD